MNRIPTKALTFVLLIITTLVLSVQCSSKFAHGKRAYNKYCADCHMEDGNGVGEIYPSLLRSNYTSDTESLPCIIKHGFNDTSTVMQMNPVEGISDIDITNIINYLSSDLLGKTEEVQIQDIQKIIESCDTNPVQ